MAFGSAKHALQTRADQSETGEANTSDAWDLLRIEGVADDHAPTCKLLDQLQAQGNTVHQRRGANCWRIELPETWEQYDWNGRSIEYHRAQLRQQLGFREASVADSEALRIWLCEQVLSTTHRLEHLREGLYQRCRDIRIEPPTPDWCGESRAS